jgi:putative ABC transport system permease protein
MVKIFSEDQIHKINILRFADDKFFTFFRFNLVEGDPRNALNSSDKIVLSKKMAEKIFGRSDPLGATLIYNQKPFTVSGVAENSPSNTHLNFDAVISIRYIEQDKENNYLGWDGGTTFLSYLKLAPGIRPSQIEAGLPDLLYENINKKIEEYGAKVSASLENIREVHLSTKVNDSRSKSSIMIVTGIGLLILLLAVVNYISLFIAQKADKIKDLSLLTIHGADRWQLIAQEYAEVFSISLISSISGVYLFSLFTQSLNNFLNTSVSINGNIFPSIVFLLILIILLSLVITLISTSGVFQFNTSNIFRISILPGKRNIIISNILVTFQFTIVVVLMISLGVIYRQNKYVLNNEKGFVKENIVTLIPDNEFKNNELFLLKEKLKMISEIESVSLTSQRVGTGLTMNGYQITGEKENTLLNVIYTDADFLNCFGVKLASGRNFKEFTSQDDYSIIVNRKLVQRAAWEDPINQTIKRMDKLLTVIGTVEDFNFASLQSEIAPLIIMCNPKFDGWGYNNVNIKYKTTDIQTLIKKISGEWESNFPGITYEISFLDDQLEGNYRSLLSQQKMVAFFSVLSIIIACMGLFGITSLMARRRTKEIGIRKINGAKVPEVILMLNKDFLKWVIISMVISVPLAWYFMKKWLLNFAYKTELHAWIFALACILVLLVALLTVSWQSWRAATRNPVDALRYE